MKIILLLFGGGVWLFSLVNMSSWLNLINNIDEYIFVFPTYGLTFYCLGFLVLTGVFVHYISIKEKGLLVAIFLIQFYISVISYGYITDNGIIYRSFHTLYAAKTVSWENVQSPVTIMIDTQRAYFSYTCDVTLKEENSEVSFDLFTFIINSEVKQSGNMSST